MEVPSCLIGLLSPGNISWCFLGGIVLVFWFRPPTRSFFTGFWVMTPANPGHFQRPQRNRSIRLWGKQVAEVVASHVHENLSGKGMTNGCSGHRNRF
jgi:hypothetical protein